MTGQQWSGRRRCAKRDQRPEVPVRAGIDMHGYAIRRTDIPIKLGFMRAIDAEPGPGHLEQPRSFARRRGEPPTCPARWLTPFPDEEVSVDQQGGLRLHSDEH